MPICQNCQKEWTWKQTIAALFHFRLKCPHCGTRQYESARSRKRGALLAPLVLIIILLNILIDISFGLSMTFAVILALILLSFYPFILKLSNEEEPYY